jgi:hypothetical protein
LGKTIARYYTIALDLMQLSDQQWVRPKKVARLSGLEGVVKQAPTVAK